MPLDMQQFDAEVQQFVVVAGLGLQNRCQE